MKRTLTFFIFTMVFFVKYSAFAQMKYHPAAELGVVNIVFFDEQTLKTVKPFLRWNDEKELDDCRIDEYRCPLKYNLNGESQIIRDNYKGLFVMLKKGEHHLSFSSLRFMDENQDLFVASDKTFIVNIDKIDTYSLSIPVRRYTKVEFHSDIENDNGVAKMMHKGSGKTSWIRQGRIFWLRPGKYQVDYKFDIFKCNIYGYISAFGFSRPSCRSDGHDIHVKYVQAGDAVRMEYTMQAETGFTGPVILQFGHMNGSAPVVEWAEAEYYNGEEITIPQSQDVVYVRVKDF